MTVHRPNNVHSAVQRLNRPPSSTGRPKTTTASSTSLNVSQISSQSTSSSSGNECVKVVVRCRPLSSSEQAQGHNCCVNVDSKSGIIELTNPQCPDEPAKCFSFDSAFDLNSKQLDVYDEAVRPIVDSVLQGFNGTVFAYGQTGTGKTYTMEGPSGIGKNIASDQRGVIPNSIDQIFQHIAQSPPSLQYLVRASFLEIYQEEIRDLLDKSGGTAPESKPPGISTNTNAACNCATGSSNKCPAGIPGPKGVRGKPGNDGKDGLNGVPGKDASDVQLAPEYERCYYCPSGQQGTVGPTGKSGPRGMKGVNGKPGVAGRDGQPGSPGDNGPPGAQGVVGQPGPVGEKGRDFHQQIGRPGSKGPKGPPGPQGPIGNPGMPAPPGPPGETPGERGNPGPPGEVGKPGSTGFEGNNGKTGPDAHYCSCPPPSFTSRTKSNGSVGRGPYNYYFGMSRRTRV